MKNKKNILILTAPFGSGHTQAAKAIKEEFDKNKNINAQILDFYKKFSPMTKLGITKAVYLQSFKGIGKNIYSLFYDFMDNTHSEEVSNILGQINFAFSIYVKKNNIDVIILTFPIATATAFAKINNFKNLYTIITDFSVNSRWMHNSNKRYFIGDDIVKRYMIIREKENESKKAVISGIPVKSIFYKKLPKIKTRKKLNIANKFTISFLFGAAGSSSTLINVLINKAKQHPNINFIAVCGRSKKIYKKINAANLDNLIVFGYVTKMNEIYYASDLIVTKPGGLTSSEMIATNTPGIFYDPIKGQEESNNVYFNMMNASVSAPDKEYLNHILDFIIENKTRVKFWKDNLKLMHKGNSAKIITKQIIKDLNEDN